LEAATSNHYFENIEQRGKDALENKDYEVAAKTFQDCYRRGIAYYRMGNFAEAEKMFRQSSREEVASSAACNLGNSLVKQQKFSEAISTYEDVLKKWPNHTKAKENLELVKQMLEQQKQDSSQSDETDQEKEKQEDKEENKSSHEDQKKNHNSSNNSEKEQNQQSQAPPKNKKSDTKEERQQTEQENQGAAKAKNQDRAEPQQDSHRQNEERQDMQTNESSQMHETPSPEPKKDEMQAKSLKSQQDQDADLWLSQITNEPKKFLQNKFYIESKRNGTTEGIDPW
jgi:Ca-activated chloride channel family protein